MQVEVKLKILLYSKLDNFFRCCKREVDSFVFSYNWRFDTIRHFSFRNRINYYMVNCFNSSLPCWKVCNGWQSYAWRCNGCYIVWTDSLCNNFARCQLFASHISWIRNSLSFGSNLCVCGVDLDFQGQFQNWLVWRPSNCLAFSDNFRSYKFALWISGRRNGACTVFPPFLENGENKVLTFGLAFEFRRLF